MGGRASVLFALCLACVCAGAAMASAGAADPAAVASRARALVPGIDVSRFNGTIDWELVRAGGVRFAFVQASRGSGADCSVAPTECGPDGFYEFNYAAARAAGVRVGPYHRAFVDGRRGRRAIRRDARAEARVFLNAVGQLRARDLRPALDMETPFAGMKPKQLRLWARTWLRRVGRRLGAKPIIYTNASSWSALGDPTGFARRGHPLWVANWEVRAPLVPAGDWAGLGWRVWQYTSSGRVRGIEGRVDLNWLRRPWREVTVGRPGNSERGSAGGVGAARRAR